MVGVPVESATFFQLALGFHALAVTVVVRVPLMLLRHLHAQNIRGMHLAICLVGVDYGPVSIANG